jgi:hypothetical protein
MNPADSIWLIPGVDARLRELHALGGAAALSMGEIADRLNREFQIGITRNSVIGRCGRTGLKRNGLTVKAQAAKKAGRPKVTRIRPIRVDAPIVPEIEPPADDTPGITILQLKRSTCRWPLGAMQDYPPFLYCGRDVRFDGPYCTAHHERACGKPIVRVA